MTPALSQGAIAFILLLAGGLTLVAGFVLVRLYRRAVDRAMRRRGQAEIEATRAPSVARPPELELRIDQAQSPRDPAAPGLALALAARRRFARGAAVYTVAGFAHAGVATLLLFLLTGIEFSPGGPRSCSGPMPGPRSWS